MIGGDISNDLPTRVWFVYDGVLARQDGTTGRAWRKRPRYVIDPEVAAVLWRLWHATAVRLEAVVFGEDHEHLAEAALDHLEREDVPISFVRGYPDRAALVAALPTLHRVIAIYDTPEHALKYGGLGQTIDQIGRLS